MVPSSPSLEKKAPDPYSIIKKIELYLSSRYSYRIEYFLEGYAIFLEDMESPNHEILIFYDFTKGTFDVSSIYNGIPIEKIEHLKVEELSRVCLRFILNLDEITLLKKHLYITWNE